jgi:hypothetical protein
VRGLVPVLVPVLVLARELVLVLERGQAQARRLVQQPGQELVQGLARVRVQEQAQAQDLEP